MLENIKNRYRVVLASNSPRRKQLLAGLGLEFEVKVLPDIDESYPPGIPVHEIAGYIAGVKASAYADMLADNELLITADTVVIVGNEVLGKPTDDADASLMLRKLSGCTHQVVTGVCLTTRRLRREFSVTTDVTFKKLTDDEINYYINNYHPLDKAGAYGIQEFIGYIGCTSLKGSYYNVMGLPVQRLYQELMTLSE